MLFYAENQRKFTYLTSEASSIIEFELIFGIIKHFIESKKFHIEDVMKSTCSFVQLFQHYESTLNVSKALEINFNPKFGEKRELLGLLTFSLLTSSES